MPQSYLKPYIVYSRSNGSEEGAALVFAHRASIARYIGYGPFNDFIDGYIDCAARLIRNAPWLFEEADKDKLSKNEAHVIINPKTCCECGFWGQSPIGDDGLCEECRDDLEDVVH
jgi:hypothetical protein